MEDAQHISSTTPGVDELRKLQGDPDKMDESKLYDEAAGYLLQESGGGSPRPLADDDILDLAGGARDALLRHRSATPPGTGDPDRDLYSEFAPAAEPGDLLTGMGGFGAPSVKQAADSPPKPEPPRAAPRSPASDPSPASSSSSSAASSPDEPIFSSSAPSQPLVQSSAVVDLLYWRDIKRTGVVFGASLFLLLSLTVCSIVSVCSYLALALLSVTVTFRIYKGVLQAVQKSDEGHPFKAYLESDVALSEELVHKYSDVALSHLNCGLKELRRLFLVEDLVDSLKFAVLMWILTYVGALFNGLTLLILALISVFSIPVIYERHQAQIDHYLGLVNNQVKDIIAKIQAKVPGLKRKAE
ncbi:reticulon-4a isoform X2 [Lepisosteus oculatus]